MKIEYAPALQAMLQFTFIWQLHRKSVPVLARENSCTVYESYVSVLTDCRWLLSFLNCWRQTLLLFLNILSSKDKVYFLRKILEGEKIHTSLPLETLELVFYSAQIVKSGWHLHSKSDFRNLLEKNRSRITLHSNSGQVKWLTLTLLTHVDLQGT